MAAFAETWVLVELVQALYELLGITVHYATHHTSDKALTLSAFNTSPMDYLIEQMPEPKDFARSPFDGPR
ncbi:Serine Palmitoyltransferase 1 [Manis pentadactyla]|nr:Serine Palmitoyltransferase 1 [Manis pentadactyla]